MNFFIIHGVYSKPEENWFPWLKDELEKKGYEVFVPKFPTPIGQSLENWMKVIKKYDNKINSDTVMVGHSLGASFILNYLEQIDKEIRAAILVSGFHMQIGSPYDKINRAFVDKKFNWERIAENCENFFVVGSDNDEFIPESITRQLAFNLDAELHIIHNGGHLNSKAGFEKFPGILEIIEKLMT